MRISKRTKFQIDKILSTRVRRGIQEYLVRWKGYGPDFDSWINATSVKNIQEMEYRKHFYITLFSNSSQKTSRKYGRRVYDSTGATYRSGFDRQLEGEAMRIYLSFTLSAHGIAVRTCRRDKRLDLLRSDLAAVCG